MDGEGVPVYVSMCLSVYDNIHGMAYMWKSENNLQKPGLSFYNVGPRHQTQAIKLGNKHLYWYQLSHPSGPCL